MSGVLGLLRRNPAFARLWLAMAVSQAGDWLSRVAVLSLIASLGGADALGPVGMLYGMELALRLLPTGFMAPLAGPVADRFSRRMVMVLADLARAAVVLSLLLVDEPSELPLLYGLVALQTGLAVFFDAARSAALPSVVRREDLLDAHAISAATWSTMLALGAFSGALVLAAVGTRGVFIADAITFVASAALLIGLPLAAPAENARLSWSGVLSGRDMRAALAHARDLGIGRVLAIKSLWGMAGGFLVLLSVLGSQRFGAAGAGAGVEEAGLAIGTLYAARGVGTGLGPLFARRFGGGTDRALVRAVAVGFWVAALGYGVLPWATSMTAACLLVLVAHAGGSAIWVSSTVLWQRHVSDAFRGRVHALEFLGLTLSFTFWGLGLGWLTDRTGSVDVALGVGAAAAFLSGLFWLVWSRSLFAGEAPSST
ncbi:MAG TPA: MFS transporter [Planctomycetota bacterium]|nr:MFS transporter [Planctomycetota bacterium]